MTHLGIGIIGAGYMARTFAECLARYTQGGLLRAVAGGTRAPATAAEFDVPALGSVEELIDRRDVDAVIVTSPHADHRDQVIAAARANKHVFLEKPMEVSVARCDEMIQACDQAGVTLCVAHVLRWRGSPRRGKEVIDAGRIGRVQIIDFTWRDVRSSNQEKAWTLDPVHGGFLLDAGVHVFDAMRWYAGADASRVFATVTRFNDTPTVAPTAMVQIQFANSVLGIFRGCIELPPPGFREPLQCIQVVGSDGLLQINPYGKVDAAIGGTWETVWEQPTIDFKVNYLNPVRLEAFAAELQDFLDSVRNARRPFATGQDGRAAVEIAEAANRSSRTGQAIALPLSQGGV
jgi:UDP-N-acetyl-2-amino-2-deoxyglucuronate dehydrogenase